MHIVKSVWKGDVLETGSFQLIKALDDGNFAIGVFLDFSNAFDIVEISMIYYHLNCCITELEELEELIGSEVIYLVAGNMWLIMIPNHLYWMFNVVCPEVLS